MLRTRIITAVILLAVFLSALFFLPALGWAWFTTSIAAIAGWEWGGLLRLSPRGRILCGSAVFALCAAIILLVPSAIEIRQATLAGNDPMAQALQEMQKAWMLGQWFYFPAAIFWCVIAPLWLWRRWRLPVGRGAGLGFFFGILLILPTWLALVQLRNAGGAWMLLATMAIVWIADTSAYFSGRAFGRRKLAPSISPGKTWAGAWGALIGVLIYGFVIAVAGEYARIFFYNPIGSMAPYALLLACLTVLSIAGDLFESLLKRQAEIKDSSAILPGHGGVLDRIDSLTSTLPIVALLFLGTMASYSG